MFHILNCAVQYMKHFIYHFTSILHGLIRTHKWPAPNVSGFIAQLVIERRTGIARSRVQTPLKSWLFQASIRNCLNCVHNCDDHSSLDCFFCFTLFLFYFCFFLDRCLVLSVYVLRFMTLGSKINSKFTNTSGLLTEQVRYSNNFVKLLFSPIIFRMGNLIFFSLFWLHQFS